MPHAFISYIREDQQTVDRLCEELRARNVEVWLDRDSIDPGQNWENAVRKAIKQGAFFLACFSRAYLARQQTYMHEELALAATILGEAGSHSGWFIPVKLTDCEVPAITYASGRSLSSPLKKPIASGTG